MAESVAATQQLRSTLSSLEVAVDAMRNLHQVLRDRVVDREEEEGEISSSTNNYNNQEHSLSDGDQQERRSYQYLYSGDIPAYLLGGGGGLDFREDDDDPTTTATSAVKGGGTSGCPPSVIDSLTVIKAPHCDQGGVLSGPCPICQEEKSSYGMQTEIKTFLELSPCGHRYCKDCIVPWLCQNDSCPVCRCTVEAGTKKVVEWKVKELLPPGQNPNTRHLRLGSAPIHRIRTLRGGPPSTGAGGLNNTSTGVTGGSTVQPHVKQEPTTENATQGHGRPSSPADGPSVDSGSSERSTVNRLPPRCGSAAPRLGSQLSRGATKQREFFQRRTGIETSVATTGGNGLPPRPSTASGGTSGGTIGKIGGRSVGTRPVTASHSSHGSNRANSTADRNVIEPHPQPTDGLVGGTSMTLAARPSSAARPTQRGTGGGVSSSTRQLDTIHDHHQQQSTLADGISAEQRSLGLTPPGSVTLPSRLMLATTRASSAGLMRNSRNQKHNTPSFRSPTVREQHKVERVTQPLVMGGRATSRGSTLLDRLHQTATTGKTSSASTISVLPRSSSSGQISLGAIHSNMRVVSSSPASALPSGASHQRGLLASPSSSGGGGFMIRGTNAALPGASRGKRKF